jgi:ATP-dependent exoDNAse (exonuclease V) alpha subunit
MGTECFQDIYAGARIMHIRDDFQIRGAIFAPLQNFNGPQGVVIENKYADSRRNANSDSGSGQDRS